MSTRRASATPSTTVNPKYDRAEWQQNQHRSQDGMCLGQRHLDRPSPLRPQRTRRSITRGRAKRASPSRRCADSAIGAAAAARPNRRCWRPSSDRPSPTPARSRALAAARSRRGIRARSRCPHEPARTAAACAYRAARSTSRNTAAPVSLPEARSTIRQGSPTRTPHRRM